MIISNSQLTSIIVNLVIFIVIAVGSIVIIQKIKLDNKGYKYLFVVYTFFWMPIMLLRSYRGTMQNLLDPQFLWIVTSVYGFVGIFIRLFADFINYLFKYRKAFLYFSLIAQMILLIPIIVNINTLTNILSAVSIGIGASCIGTYELLFKEQYGNGNKKAFLTISILSIPPLLANFITAPIQSIVKIASTVNGHVETNKLIIMWYIGLGLLIIAFIMLMLYKERKRVTYSLINKKIEKLNTLKIKNNNSNTLFITLAIIGSIIAFVKFSNSGSMGTLHLQNLAYYSNNSCQSYEGYLSVVFSIAQLLAGIMVGTYLIKRMNTISIFTIGIVSWIIYCLSSAFIRNPIGYFAIHLLNGFGYGILYNLVLAIVLSITINNRIITKVGLYQSILAIGITVSGWFTNWLKTILHRSGTFDSYMYTYMVQNMILICVIVVIYISFILVTINNKSYPYKYKLKNKIHKKIYI